MKNTIEETDTVGFLLRSLGENKNKTFHTEGGKKFSVRILKSR